MGDSASVKYIVMQKHPCHQLAFAVRDALRVSLNMDYPVYLQVAAGQFLEVDATMAVDVIESQARHATLPTGGY